MNLRTPQALKPHRKPLKRKRRSGVALVLVLGMLVLVSILAVAFLTSVSVERRAADSYVSALDTRTLADTAVNVVIAQIQDATETPTLAWASQPGMIRTYNNVGEEVDAYKLYSSDTLKVSGGFNANSQAAAEVPANWAQRPQEFTDLNAPAYVAGTPRYPIIDPSAVATGQGSTTSLVAGGTPVQGAYISPTAALNVTPEQPNPLPLPVRWLYQLQDGTMAAADADGTVPNATVSNPIVGRIAYWTDDESAKVNVNTAAEGTFWDRPYADSTKGAGTKWDGYERGFLGFTMPAQNEFQRYPGHPATTSLSTIFPLLVGETKEQYNERIYGIIPRVVGGGSSSGTVQVKKSTAIPIPDNDRLFASVDEFMFRPNGAPLRSVSEKGPATQFTEEDMERTQFFLTANSRAPEVNLFNKPRITIWPLQVDPDPNSGDPTRTAQDKLIAFCSTIGSKPYYFQRYNTYRPDLNDRASTDYMSTMQSPRPSSQSQTMDWEEIPRNQELYTYLQSLTDQSIPGLGGSLGGTNGKYRSRVRDQILTEMVDYIRSSLNSVTTGVTPEYFYAPATKKSTYGTKGVTGDRQIVPLELPNGTRGFGRFPSVKQAALVFYRQDNQLVPTPTGVAQPGAPYKIGAVLILDPFNVSPGTRPWSQNVRYVVRGLNKKNNPVEAKRDDFLIKEAGTDTTATIVTPFPEMAANVITSRDAITNATAISGIEYAFTYYDKEGSDLPKKLGPTIIGSSDEEENYPFYADFVLNSGTKFDFTGGEITIEIYAGYSSNLDATDLVQTIKMTFPPSLGLPIPTVGYTINDGVRTVKYTNFQERLDAKHIGTAGYHSPKPLIRPEDVVRSVEARYSGPAKGDLRVFAAMKEVPASYFEGHGVVDNHPDGIKYTDVPSNINDKRARIHSLRVYSPPNMVSGTGAYTGAFYGSAPVGKLVAGVDHIYTSSGPRLNQFPIVPSGLPAAIMENGALGDWDTGPGAQADGPYINKADEGTSAILSNEFDYGGYYILGRGGSTVEEAGPTYSPNRQAYSPVMFGSLPTGIDPTDPLNVKPWQTLLFTAQPAAGTDHPGFGTRNTGTGGAGYSKPPDHAFLDLFTMPVVEPYAISDPFSTAGKINMNYQMVPFTYLTRNTGLRAVMKPVRMMAIPTGDGLKYKSSGNKPDPYRYEIDVDEVKGTLAGFEERFANGDIFRSASEICDISLVPGGRVDGQPVTGNPTYSSMGNWWRNYQLTGDNLRETPYGHIYPRLTTKSNTYTVHVRAQSLRKARGTNANVFQENRDVVTGEFRGSFIVQRYLDPNSDSLVLADGSKAINENDPDAMVGPYKFRTISSKRFDP